MAFQRIEVRFMKGNEEKMILVTPHDDLQAIIFGDPNKIVKSTVIKERRKVKDGLPNGVEFGSQDLTDGPSGVCYLSGGVLVCWNRSGA